eukprot:1003977_1
MGDSSDESESKEIPPDSCADQLYETLEVDRKTQVQQLEEFAKACGMEFKRTWCVRAMVQNNYQLNASFEWIMSHTSHLKEMDKREDDCAQRRIERKEKKKEQEKENVIRLEKLKSLAPILAMSDCIGTVLGLNGDKVQLQFIDENTSAVQKLWCPKSALEWPDQWLWDGFSDLVFRTNHGAHGLCRDISSALYVLYARRAVVDILQATLRARIPVPGAEQVPSKMIISILKLVVGDPYFSRPLLRSGNTLPKGFESSMRGSELSPKASVVERKPKTNVGGVWPLLYSLAVDEKYGNVVIRTFVDEAVRLLKNSSVNCIDHCSSHPYRDDEQEKQEFGFDSATALMISFDRRSSLREGHAFIAFFLDEECTEELSAIAGSGGHRFRPLVVPDSHVWMAHESKQSTASQNEFGFKMRVTPLGNRYEDETELLDSPTFGWRLLSLLTSRVEVADKIIQQTDLRDKLLGALFKYLTCDTSPWKVFVAQSLTRLLVRVHKFSQTHVDLKLSNIRAGFKDQIGKVMGIMHQLHKANRAEPGLLYSPLLMALIDLSRIFCDPDVRRGMWKSNENFVLCNVDRAETLLRAIIDEDDLPDEKVITTCLDEFKDFSVLMWCLSQFEVCINISQQIQKWKEERKL